MPQISAEDIVDVYPFKKGDVSLSKMKPVQKDRLEKKHKEAKQKIESNKVKPIVLDKSGRIVNGHHRYDVYKELGQDKVPAIIVDASLEELMDRFKHTAKEEGGAGGGGGGAGAGAGAGGGAAGGTGGSTGGDGGATSSSGDSGSADSGDAGDSGSDSAEATPTPAPSRAYFIGSMAPYKKSKKKKKKKKKQSFKFGQGVYEDEIEFKSDIGAVLEKCWKGYKKKGMKTMFGKRVPNCVKNESIEPNFDFEWDEAKRYPEFEKLGKDKWIELAKSGKEEKITDASNINNTDAGAPESFYDLEKDKQQRALQQIARGDVELPIIARYSDGHLELIGGNTRLTAMMLRKGSAKVWMFDVPDEILDENFKDGKVKGKSRPGRVKKAGASCKGSVSSLRAKAKKYGGEKGKMYHWCANMKGGKKK